MSVPLCKRLDHRQRDVQMHTAEASEVLVMCTKLEPSIPFQSKNTHE